MLVVYVFTSLDKYIPIKFFYDNAIKFILVSVGYIECASCGLAQPRRYVFLFVMDFLVNNWSLLYMEQCDNRRQ